MRLFRAVRAALAVAVVDRPSRGEVGWDEGGKQGRKRWREAEVEERRNTEDRKKR